ncbi:MAG: enoyl-CoA hydratase, partial [Candidatus Aeolococcus gillhamiae]
AFCAGADLKAARGGMDHDRGMGLDLPALLTKVADSPKPVIARIAGHCMGGGVGLAAACDLSVAADDVRFGFTEVRIGVAPAIISVVCLAKLRRGDAMELFLTGERVSAARAAEVGLINRAVPRPSLAAEVSRIAGAVMAGGPGALGAAKRLVNEVPSMPTTEAFRYTAALSAELFGSAEASEGMAAFREKRPADWAPGR